MEKLIKLLDDGEQIAAYGITGSYCTYYCIVPEGKELAHIDLGACLEDTFRRIMENHGKETVSEIMGAELMDGIEEDRLADGYVPLDLGYILPGALASAWIPERGQVCA